MVKTKIIFLAILTLSFGWLSYQNVNTAQAADRYKTECGIDLSTMSPEDYLAETSRMWNYDLNSMPKYLYDAYVCVNWVNIQDEAGIISSGSPYDKEEGNN